MTSWRADPGDAAVVAAMLARFNVEFDTEGPTAEEFAGRFAVLLGRPDVLVRGSGDRADPSGFIFCTQRPSPYYDGPIVQLEEFWVRPEDRGRGLGTELLTEAVRWARAQAAGEININVDEPDHATRRFYERHGFSNLQPGSTDRMLCYLIEL